MLLSWGSSAAALPQILGTKTPSVGLCPADRTQGSASRPTSSRRDVGISVLMRAAPLHARRVPLPSETDRDSQPSVHPSCFSAGPWHLEGLLPNPEDAAAATVVPTGRADHRFPLCSCSPLLFAHHRANSNKQNLLLSPKALNFNSSTQRLFSLINFTFIYDLL